jgi:hypothetical protein
MRYAALLAVLVATPALAEEVAPRQAPEAAEVAATGNFLPTVVGARVEPAHMTALGLGGHDGAPGQGGVFSGIVEAGVYKRVAIRVGFDKLGDAKASALVGLRVGLTEQERSGLDLSVGAQYKNRGFSEVAGEVEVLVSAGRRWGDLALLANLVFGQGTDAGERDGEARTGLYYTLSRAFGLGFDARARVDLGHEDAARTMNKLENDFDMVAGPLVTVTHGQVLALVQAGDHTLVSHEQAKSGLIVMGGLGCTF